jgi:CRP-like cAMP-binding protein
VAKLREDAESLTALFKSLKYEDCESGKAVFEYGDAGSTFYVILAGAVEIKVPMPVELEGSSATPEGLLIFLVTYFDNICWEKLHNGLSIKRELAEQLRQLGLSIKNKDKSELLLHLGRCIVKKTTEVHLRIHRLFEMRNESIKLHWTKTVQTLGPGESFGERALEKHEVRAATAHCSKDCIFATLYRNDYNHIIGQAHKREVRAMSDYLRQYRILSQLRASVLERIQYYLQPRSFTLGQTLFKEGISKVDGVYFIKQGEFEITVSSHSTTLAATPRSSQQTPNSSLGQLCRSKSTSLLRSL